MWKKCGRAGQSTNDSIVRFLRFACWVTKVRDAHSEYVILNAFPLRQWFRTLAGILRFTYIDCLVKHVSSLNVVARRCDVFLRCRVRRSYEYSDVDEASAFVGCFLYRLANSYRRFEGS
jgi:hypothetical protein